jgi:hypothetical protein
MKGIFLGCLLIGGIFCSCKQTTETKLQNNKFIQISKSSLRNKIKGGWAGQTIGCTYGGSTEFRFKGTMIQDYQTIPWPDGYMKQWYTNAPGLYDDVYMDLTFVNVFDKYGLDTPVDSFAKAFAYAGYDLWHANQSARYNILNCIMPPKSGFWKNNPHADCIDFQIEADFAGLMSPGMPNTASKICDKIGHIMNYGDGWYGGVYVAAMYSLAFVSNNVEFVVTEALKSIPDNSEFHQCIQDVINDYKSNPNDWKTAWFHIQKKWTEDVGCPEGIFDPFDIDAKVNAAYVVMGLLYGKGNFDKTLDIATRAGQDSDCNPATAGGILGTIIGYDQIPEKWMKNLKEVEDMDFKYTTMSLNKVYKMGYSHALKNIEKNGGNIQDTLVSLKYQSPVAVAFEKCFVNLLPVVRQNNGWIGKSSLKTPHKFDFEGNAIVVTGGVNGDAEKMKKYVALVEVTIDGQHTEKISMPLDFTKRRNEIYWNYDLGLKKHSIEIKWLNPKEGCDVVVKDWIVYGAKKQ